MFVVLCRLGKQIGANYNGKCIVCVLYFNCQTGVRETRECPSDMSSGIVSLIICAVVSGAFPSL